MQRYIKWFSLFILMVVLPAHAELTPKQEKAKLLLELSEAETSIDIMYDQMQQMVSQQVAVMGVKPDEEAILEGFMQQFVEEMRTTISWEAMLPEFITIYADVYTEAELDGLIAFYQSPVGQAFIEKQPLIMQQSQPLTQELAMQFVPKIQLLITDFKRDLDTHRANQVSE